MVGESGCGKRVTPLAILRHIVWSLDFKYARYAKKLRRDLWICRPRLGKLWVGEFRAETVRLGPGADHRLPPIVVYNNINLK